MQMDMWATAVPSDLLLDIFRRLGSTAVIRSAAMCRPWRRAIIDNASCLRPRPDRFLPDLLLAFSDKNCRHGRLEYQPAAGTSENAPALDAVDVSPYQRLLASRDGLFLLGEHAASSSSLCLFNPLTGSRRFVPAAEFGARSYRCTYVLVTSYDDDSLSLPDADGAGESLVVRILAVVEEENGISYRIFSSTSIGGAGGAWGHVKRSAKIIEEEDLVALRVLTEPNKHVVVCDGSVVYWLVMVSTGNGSSRTCLFAMDMRTERTWTTELPEERDTSDRRMMFYLVVATSEDGRQLSLILPLKGSCQVEVWVLDGDSRWTLQRTLDMESLLRPDCWTCLGYIWVCGFCPRSGCLFGVCKYDYVIYDFLVGIDGSSPRLIQRADSSRCSNMHPYEMCLSTYISKMKYF